MQGSRPDAMHITRDSADRLEPATRARVTHEQKQQVPAGGHGREAFAKTGKNAPGGGAVDRDLEDACVLFSRSECRERCERAHRRARRQLEGAPARPRVGDVTWMRKSVGRKTAFCHPGRFDDGVPVEVPQATP